jgi:hypothetical protein
MKDLKHDEKVEVGAAKIDSVHELQSYYELDLTTTEQ